MTIKRGITTFLSLIAVTWLYAADESQKINEAGVVVFTSGTVDATDAQGKTHALGRGSAFYTQETIITEDTAKAKLRFTDGNLVSLAPNTAFKVNAYAYNPDVAKENTYSVKLLRGSMLTVSGAIVRLHPEGYKIETDVGSIGIWSTTVLIQISSDPKTGKQKLVTTNVESGEKGVTTTLPNGKVFHIKPNQSISLSVDAACLSEQTKNVQKECPVTMTLTTLSISDTTQSILDANIELFTASDGVIPSSTPTIINAGDTIEIVVDNNNAPPVMPDLGFLQLNSHVAQTLCTP